MPFAFDWLYRQFGFAYVGIYLIFAIGSAAVVCLGTVGLFTLYEDVGTEDFWTVLLFAEVWVMAALAWTLAHGYGHAKPLLRWMRHGGGREAALEAWHSAVSLPRAAVVGAGWQPFVIAAVPISIFAALRFDLPLHSAVIVFAGILVAIAYAAVLNFFATELFYRPVLREIVRELPPDFAGEHSGVPLRWKLLGALPLINVITGVVVSGLSSSGRASLDDLGLDVLVAVIVAFTLSLELTLLVTKSVLNPVHDLLLATERVKRGDLSARVPVLSGDELGALAGSFNAMLTGLEERETLREAFGSYVDPEVARRVLEEGELLEGQEVEATVMFVDIRDFTSFAESASAREAVERLNGFFALVVPVVMEHGGHANKFIGDGLLAVFGTPERLPDHADRALAAACEIFSRVERRYEGGVRIGVGINSGPVVAGSVGGGGRLEFTVIGDPVNVAARVEKATREVGDSVLLTESTRCLLSRDDVAVEPRGEVRLRGKSEPVPIYAPAPEGDPGQSVQDPARSSRSAAERTRL